METRLLDLLVCPLCKGPLQHARPPLDARHELICRADRLAYPVRDGIPVMLESEARVLDDNDTTGPAVTPLGATPAAATEPPAPPATTP